MLALGQFDFSAEGVNRAIDIANRTIDTVNRALGIGKEPTTGMEPLGTGSDQEETATNYVPWIVGGLVVLAAVGTGAYFLTRRRGR